MALNLNVGILGHVDSGKTSFAKALSEIASTAAFDKNPQSQARGITLDLGFSSFSIPMPDHLKNECKFETMQFTLVDCPGHASLIRTIIGGAQIIDLMLLVIDVTKGIQTQTAECLVIGEITCKKMIIVLNKIDLLEEGLRTIQIEKMKKKLRTTLASSCFVDAPIVSISAHPECRLGLEEAVVEISKFSFLPSRCKDGQFLFSVDHCFSIKGQGTIMTGTVLQGSVRINDEIHIPALGTTKKVKSMQMFKKPVTSASQGDRLGICVTQFDPKLMERGVVCSPGLTSFANCAVICVNKVKYFKGLISTKAKFHITIGHETSIATISLFSSSSFRFNFESEYEYMNSLEENSKLSYFMLLEFEKPVLVVDNSLVIGSKLDMDIHANSCRLAFWGRILAHSKDKTTFLPCLKIYKKKLKEGVVERLVDEKTVVVKNMFKKNANLQPFVGFKVELSTGEKGRIESTFGQSGKIKVQLEKGFDPGTLELLDEKCKKDSVKVLLHFKRFIFDVNKKMYQ